MRLHLLSPLIILLCIMIVPFSSLAETSGSVFIFEPHPGYSFSARANGETSWPENSNQLVFLNISVVLIPNNISRIYIDSVSFSIIGQIAGVDQAIGGVQNVPEAILSNNSQTLYLNVTLTAPKQVDRFYLDIGILARSDGNNTRDEYSLRFPDSTTIVVERDNLVPLIDLYGFPPDAFFKKFLPVYIFIFTIFSLPGFVFLGVRARQKFINIQVEVTE